MAIGQAELTNVLINAFEEAEVKVVPLVQDDDHYSVHIKSASFKGKSLVTSHRMVYQALKEAEVDVHAIEIKIEEK
jgi:stress-induced morphogen